MEGLMVNTPVTEFPDDPYEVIYYNDFAAYSHEGPFEANEIVRVGANQTTIISSDAVFDFYDN